MKGNKKIISILNSLLTDELTAINQYMVRSEMCENWGYTKLYTTIRKQAMDEMHHAEWLIERIIFYDSAPIVSKLNNIKIGNSISEIIGNGNGEELEVIDQYNYAIKVAREVSDQVTVDLLTRILEMEEGHLEWAEAQRVQIEQMGVENYLSVQTESLVYA